MKNLAIILLILLLGILAFFRYANYKRFHPPVDYEYAVNPNIDVNYHDPMVVQQYYTNAYEIGNFARQQWHNYKIDVRFIKNKKSGSAQASNVYSQMVSTTKILEQKLLNSNELKAQGLDNAAVKYVEEEGITGERYRLEKQIEKVNLTIGDNGEHVAFFQTKLSELGYDLQADGKFSTNTMNAVIQFQLDNDLIPTGVANEEVFAHLLK